MTTKWSDDAFLNELRNQTDEFADDILDHETPQALSNLFGSLIFNGAYPEDASERVVRFFRETRPAPVLDGEPLDAARLDRGARAFWAKAFASASVLVTKSMIEGYAAPNLTKILCLAGDLATDTYRRLIHTLEMLVNVSATGSFEERGEAIITAQKLRLLHAGLRHDVRLLIEPHRDGLAFRHLKPNVDFSDFRKTHQEPLNFEDMLGVTMGLSHLVVEGLETLGVPMTPEEIEDYYYVWRAFALKMGVHPTGAPNDDAFVPANAAEAREFYESYKRRHFAAPEDNPEGILLAKAQMATLNQRFVPGFLRWVGLPESYLRILIGKKLSAQVGVRTKPWHPVTATLLYWLPRGWQWLSRRLGAGQPRFHEWMGRRVFRGLISGVTGGPEVTFVVPDVVVETDTRDRRKSARRLRELTRSGGDRRGGDDRRVFPPRPERPEPKTPSELCR